MFRLYPCTLQVRPSRNLLEHTVRALTAMAHAHNIRLRYEGSRCRRLAFGIAINRHSLQDLFTTLTQSRRKGVIVGQINVPFFLPV